MRRFLPILLLLATHAAFAQSVQITQKPASLVYGDLPVSIQTSEPVVRVALFINGVKYSEGSGKFIVQPVKVGEYLRRLRIRVVGYDAQGNVAGEDEMVVNDPKPPFRIRLHANHGALEATVVKP
ncbi:MAG: hypothetical protein ACRD3J_20350, partial [Thermoanaerobaculia bacterium]